MAIVKGNILTFNDVTDVHDCRTAKEVLEKAGLNWQVAKAEVFAKMPGAVDYENSNPNNINRDDNIFFVGSNSFKPVTNAFCTYRTDKNIPLGMVKDRYTPVQNHEAFRIFDDIIGPNTAQWFTAGCYGDGEKVFITAKLGEDILVRGKDPVNLYLVFSTTHDGTQSVRIMLTPIRLICWNAMNSAICNQDSSITIRHTISAHNKIDTATEVLQIAKRKAMLFEDMLNQMTKIKFTDKEALEAFGYVLLTKTELDNLANAGYKLEDLARKNYSAIEESGISMKKVNQFNEMISYYHLGAGQQEWMGTGYGVYNAVNGYYSNCTNDKDIKRFDKLLYGNYADKIAKIGDYILN